MYREEEQIPKTTHRMSTQEQGMQSRDSCVQREQAPALRYCIQEP